MKNTTKYQNQKVLVLGLARSGFSAAKLLHNLGALVTVNDGKPFEENPEAQELLSLGVKVIVGSHPLELLDEEFAFIVKNPGIPYTHPLVARAEELHLPIITEVELAYEVADCPIVGITGTNGKTTTTTMIAQVLNNGMPTGEARVCGNIGYPASDVAQKAQENDVLVMELSSFQLMGVDQFRPQIGVITNLFSAHLDYHGSREDYVGAKWHLQNRMTANDYLVLNWNQEEVRQLATKTNATVVPFSTIEKVAGAYLLDGYLYYHDEQIMRADELGIPGSHNVENALATIVVAKLQGITTEKIAQALKQFTGVPHRTQFVDKVNDVQFFNDSKATNILATKMALDGFVNEQLILLAGGLDRGNDFAELIPVITGLKAIVLFGETKQRLAEIAKSAGVEVIELTENVESAVPLAFKFSQPGDTILLSPANASWDQYKDFEARGDRFIEAVAAIKKTNEMSE